MGSKPFPFEIGPRRRRRLNELLGVGLLKISNFISDIVHNPIEGSPHEAFSGGLVKVVNEFPEQNEYQDNMKAAMDAAMTNSPMTRKTNTNSEPGKPASKQFLLRMTQEEHESWRVFSDSLGVSMAEMVREAVRVHIANNKATTPEQCDRTDCRLVSYPWGVTVCQRCDKKWRS